MSKDTDDIQNDDAAMDASEFEISSRTEVTIEMHSYVEMDSAEFEEKLNVFFTRYKPSKLRLVSRIAFEFRGNETFVLEHLHNKYVLGLVAEKPKAKISHTPGEHVENPKNIKSAEVEKPKSKKKLIIMVSIIVLLAGLGVMGFMMKDKLMAMIGKGPKTEQGEAKIEAKGENPKVASQPKEEVAPKTEAIDSTKTEPTDSAKTN